MGRELAQIALRIEDRISRAASETMDQQKKLFLRVNASEAMLNAQLVQHIVGFSENYQNLNLTLISRQASLAYGETDIILTHVAPTEGRIIRKKVGELSVRAYRNATLEFPTQDGLQQPTVLMKPLSHPKFLPNLVTCHNLRCTHWI